MQNQRPTMGHRPSTLECMINSQDIFIFGIFVVSMITTVSHQMSCFWTLFKKNENDAKITGFKINAESKSHNGTVVIMTIYSVI